MSELVSRTNLPKRGPSAASRVSKALYGGVLASRFRDRLLKPDSYLMACKSPAETAARLRAAFPRNDDAYIKRVLRRELVGIQELIDLLDSHPRE